MSTSTMADHQTTSPEKHAYSVWAVPPESVTERIKKLMAGLRSEFGGPEFEPHVTVVGAIELTESDALQKFRSSCEGFKAYDATVVRVATGTFFYQCVYLLLDPAPKVVEASVHCCSHFGSNTSTHYMPHMSILYGDLTDDEKKEAKERAEILDESISSLCFPITRFELVISDTDDKTCKSWRKVSAINLPTD